jgi:hypothetical protein
MEGLDFKPKRISGFIKNVREGRWLKKGEKVG